MTPDAWNAASQKISVFASGASLYGWPAGIKVQEYIHRGDWVPFLTKALSGIRHGFSNGANHTTSIDSNDSILAWMRYLHPGGPPEVNPHNFMVYLNDSIDFTLQEFRDRNGQLNPGALAHEIVTNLSKGTWSDAFAERIICGGIRESGASFASALKSELGCQNTHPDLAIGGYRMSRKLQKLIAASEKGN